MRTKEITKEKSSNERERQRKDTKETKEAAEGGSPPTPPPLLLRGRHEAGRR